MNLRVKTWHELLYSSAQPELKLSSTFFQQQNSSPDFLKDFQISSLEVDCLLFSSLFKWVDTASVILISGFLINVTFRNRISAVDNGFQTCHFFFCMSICPLQSNFFKGILYTMQRYARFPADSAFEIALLLQITLLSLSNCDLWHFPQIQLKK